MPNIELHGYRNEEEEELRGKLRGTFEHVSYRSHIVISRPQNYVRTIENLHAPFVRVYITADDPAANDDLEQRLRELNVDVEIVELKKFIPKKE